MELPTVQYPNFYYEGKLVASYCARAFEPHVITIKATGWNSIDGGRCLYFHDADVSYEYDQVESFLKASVQKERHTYAEMCHVLSFWKALEQGCYFDASYMLPIAVDKWVGVRFYVNAFQAISNVGKTILERPPPEMFMLTDNEIIDLTIDDGTASTALSTLPDNAYTATVGSWSDMSSTVDLTGIDSEEFAWEGLLLDEDMGLPFY